MATFRWPVGWDPFAGLRHVQRELERLTGRWPFSESSGLDGGGFPPVNVLNGPDEILVQCEMPGLRRDDIDLSITGETLVIKGRKQSAADETTVTYQRRERPFGDFTRTIVLPDSVDAARIEAKLADGILTVRLAKSQAAKPRQIPVK